MMKADEPRVPLMRNYEGAPNEPGKLVTTNISLRKHAYAICSDFKGCINDF